MIQIESPSMLSRYCIAILEYVLWQIQLYTHGSMIKYQTNNRRNRFFPPLMILICLFPSNKTPNKLEKFVSTVVEISVTHHFAVFHNAFLSLWEELNLCLISKLFKFCCHQIFGHISSQESMLYITIFFVIISDVLPY